MFNTKLKSAITDVKIQKKIKIIVETVLEHCVNAQIIDKEGLFFEEESEQLKAYLEKQLRSINLTHLAIKTKNPDDPDDPDDKNGTGSSILIDEEIDIKCSLLTKWISKSIQTNYSHLINKRLRNTFQKKQMRVLLLTRKSNPLL